MAATVSTPTETSALPELYAPIQADLIAAQGVFDEELVSQLPFVNDLCATVRSYRGKMLRPALLLLAGKVCGRLTPHHHTVAAVVEMVHMATLVHDDVLDGAEQRRKKPTIAATDGNTAAVLLGDYLISHAFHLCSSLPSTHASRRIGAISNIVCEGELMQNRCRSNLAISECNYMEIIRRKTAALTAVSCELGAHLAGADTDTEKRLYEFGERAGCAFQIMDDVLDLIGDADYVGKTLGRDLAQGKMTLPLIHAISHVSSAEKSILVGALQGESTHTQTVREILEAAGSLQYAVSAARDQVASALAQLQTLPQSPAKGSLVGLAEFILSRTY